jgi:3-oxoacyl-[acyl-carrier-protein] synthase-3
MTELYIQSLGVYLPAGRMTGQEAVELGLYEEEQLLDSGVQTAIVAQGEPPVDMAVYAARDCLERCGADGRTVGLLVHGGLYWQGPLGWSPLGYIMEGAGLPDAAGYDVHQGCNGILAGVEIAAGQFARDPRLSRAVVTTSLNADSPLVNRWSSAGPGIVLSDSASALLIGREPGFARLDSIASLTVAALEGLHRGDEPLLEPAEPRGIDAMARIRGWAAKAPFPLAEVHTRMSKAYSEVIQRSLDEAGIRPDQLDRVLFNHLPEHFVDLLIMQPLGLPLSASTAEFGQTVGHLGASDQTVSLDHLMRLGELKAGDRVLLAGGAPGYNVASAVITVLEQPAWSRQGAA